jgi:hypothetical protein
MKYFLLSIPYWIIGVSALMAYQAIPFLVLHYGLSSKLLLYLVVLVLSVAFVVGIGVAIMRRSNAGYLASIFLGIILILSLFVPRYFAYGYISCFIGCQIPGLLTVAAFLIGVVVPFQWYVYRKEKKNTAKLLARREALLFGLAIIFVSLVAYAVFRIEINSFSSAV